MRLRAMQTLFRASNLLCKCVPAYSNCAITYSQLKNTKHFSTELKDEFDDGKVNQETDSVSSKMKYKVFEDKDADVILDMYEEKEVSLEELEIQKEILDPYEGLNLERGVRGVYNIEDLVSVLRKEKAKDIFVATVPAEYNYVDYMVLVTGKSSKHLEALAEFVMKVYKKKRNSGDQIPKVEGKDDWIAIDLGNIALHMFKHQVRQKYDLETLWSVGPDYDDETQKPCSTNIMDQYNTFVASFEPVNDANQAQKEE